MKIIFRADSSLQIGSGHVMRCLTLAGYLKKQGNDSMFICRKHSRHIGKHIESLGHELRWLPEPPPGAFTADAGDEYAAWLGLSQETDAAETAQVLRSLPAPADWLVVDHYALDRTWHLALKPLVGNLFVIDDLANRPHDCRVLLDHNLNSDGGARYRGLVPPECQLLCGPEYALLRDEFVKARKKLRVRDGKVRRVLVFFGGVDESNETKKACEALSRLTGEVPEVDVVLGLANPHREQIAQFCAVHRHFVYHCQIANMGDLMARADLSIGAGGTTSWERAYLGLPTIIITLAANQVSGTEALAAAGAAWNLGFRTDVTSGRITTAVSMVIQNPDSVRTMSQKALALFGDDPTPGVERVARVMTAEAYAAS